MPYTFSVAIFCISLYFVYSEIYLCPYMVVTCDCDCDDCDCSYSEPPYYSPYSHETLLSPPLLITLCEEKKLKSPGLSGPKSPYLFRPRLICCIMGWPTIYLLICYSLTSMCSVACCCVPYSFPPVSFHFGSLHISYGGFICVTYNVDHPLLSVVHRDPPIPTHSSAFPESR